MKVGIITFHGSHNHGSMIQAYATQRAIEKIGIESEIINFRMKSQKEYYSLYPMKFGTMRFFRSLCMLPIHMARKKRSEKFENFLRNRFLLSGKELANYDDLKSVSEKYDLYLSGSDQIWSNLIPEFKSTEADYTGVYFLDFVNKQKRKISYASSVGEISYEDLSKKKELLESYSCISTREKKGSEIIESITHKEAKVVVDPTFLLHKQEWQSIVQSKPIIKEKYVFLYTLRGIRPGIKWGKHLTKFASRFGLKVVCVSPFFPILVPGVTNLVNVGPEDFLNLIDNAEVVFTDSFHGTAFSINFNKPFYSLNKKDSKDERKLGILKAVGLEKRCIRSFDEIDRISLYDVDYTAVNEKLNLLRNNGFDFLKKAILEE